MAAVHVSGWQTAYAGLMPQPYLDGLDVAERAANWRQGLSRSRDRDPILVVTVDAAVAGFAAFGPQRDDEGQEGELYAIYVDPVRWRMGLGARLLTAAHGGLMDLGYQDALLWVLPGNARARHFYERNDWTPDGADRVEEIFGVTVSEIRYRRSFSAAGSAGDDAPTPLPC